MPELPDLMYMQKYLRANVRGRTVTACGVHQPVVLRNTIDEPPDALLVGTTLTEFTVRGPFLTVSLSRPIQLIVHLMLAGRVQHQHSGERPEGHLCISFALDDGSRLNICDDQKMAKVYVVRTGDYGKVPKYVQQGIDVLSREFSINRFLELAEKHRRKQVRVFINDQTILSAIGNAYADEILFEARIHPKTFVARLSREQLEALYGAIRSVIVGGINEVEKAQQPIQKKVREHMKVRNRKGERCPRCGSTIRREGVRGYDVFFCPTCQPPSRKLFIDWRKTAR